MATVLFFAVALASLPVYTTTAGVPYGLRVDLTAVSVAVPLPFVTLDVLTGAAPNVSLMWALPPGATQVAWAVTVTSRAGTVAWDSGAVASPAQAASFPRVALAAATGYTWTAAVQPAAGAEWQRSAPAPFFTSASSSHWAASAPIWAPDSDGSCGPTPAGAPPAFARFSAAISMPAGAAVESAFLFITGAPPVYPDPWNVTKLLGGYALRVGGPEAPLLGLGPGRTACGPYAMGPCAPVQPYDGYDLTAAATAAAARGITLPLFVESYGLPQPHLGIAPAVQAVLVVRFAGASAPPPLVAGTSSAASGGWRAANADAVRVPGGSKTPFWYTQPEERFNASCALAPEEGEAPAGCCPWVTPAPAPAAWAHGAVPLAGKTTQPLQVLSGVVPASVLQLGPGWWVADMGGEHMGGLEVRLEPALAPGGALPALTVLVQLGEELAANGSARWQLRAGCNYRDRWHFPATTAAAHLYASHHEYSEFRWAEVLVLEAASGAPVDVPLEALGLAGWTVRYPYADEAAATLATSSPELDAVWSLAATTLKVTTLDFIADSNTRQRSLDCMADDTTAALSFYATTAELALPRLVAAQIMAIGPQGYVSPNWADWTVLPALNIVNDAWATGDFALAAPLLQALALNHTYLSLVDAASGLVHNGPGLGALVDTSGGDDDGFEHSEWDAVVQAWCYAAMKAIAPLAAQLGHPAVAAQLTAAASALQSGFNAAFFNGTAVCDGRCADTPHTSAHASFYALAFGLVDAAHVPAVAAYLRMRAVTGAGPLGVPCGAYPVQFLLQALYADGDDHGAAAFAVLTSAAPHGWLSMMAAWGATATMEAWLPSELENLSFSHVWSSSPAFLIPQYFFGLTFTAPGAAAVSVRPQPGPVRSGRASLPTVRGPVIVAFQQPAGAGGCFELQTVTPGGVTARLYVPRWGAAPGGAVNVTLDGAAVAAPGVEGDYFFVDGVATGSHTLTTC